MISCVFVRYDNARPTTTLTTAKAYLITTLKILLFNKIGLVPSSADSAWESNAHTGCPINSYTYFFSTPPPNLFFFVLQVPHLIKMQKGHENPSLRSPRPQISIFTKGRNPKKISRTQLRRTPYAGRPTTNIKDHSVIRTSCIRNEYGPLRDSFA